MTLNLSAAPQSRSTTLPRKSGYFVTPINQTPDDLGRRHSLGKANENQAFCWGNVVIKTALRLNQLHTTAL